MSDRSPRVRVVAGVLSDRRGRVLIAQRPAGKHMAGLWEFPGGKRSPREGREAALARELDEELGVGIRVARPLIRYVHRYPERTVELDVWRVERYEGCPAALEGQALAWVAPEELADRPLLPADRPIVNAIRLPAVCVITGAFEDAGDLLGRARSAMEAGAKMVQLRVPGAGPRRVRRLLDSLAPACRRRGVPIVVNGDPEWTATLAGSGLVDGIHLPARHLAGLSGRPVASGLIAGASCHDRRELEAAMAAGLDYAFLSPVRRTRSHPEAVPLGWRGFGMRIEGLGLPVYGLGGLAPADLAAGWRAGAQGIAAISSLWPDSPA